MPSPLAQALCLTRQHYRRTVPSGVDNNIIIVYLAEVVGCEGLFLSESVLQRTNVVGWNITTGRTELQKMHYGLNFHTCTCTYSKYIIKYALVFL